MSAAPNLYHPEDGWQHHASSTCPLPSDAIVRVQFRCGKLSIHEYEAGKLVWRQRDQPFDIVAYEVISMPEAQG